MLNPLLASSNSTARPSEALRVANMSAPVPTPNADMAVDGDKEFRETFDKFVGQTLFGSLLKELRKSEQGAAYINGGQAEKVFKGQLDQVLVERMSEASAETLTGPMYDLMMANRRL